MTTTSETWIDSRISALGWSSSSLGVFEERATGWKASISVFSTYQINEFQNEEIGTGTTVQLVEVGRFKKPLFWNISVEASGVSANKTLKISVDLL